MTQTTHPEHDEELESLVRWIADKAQAFAEDKPVATFPVDEIRKRIAAHTAKAVEEAEKVTGETSDGYHTFNELYEFRKAYNALLFNIWAHTLHTKVVKSKRHSDGEECFGGGWFVVVAETPVGQITNHYELKDWDLFQVPEVERAPEWDGHTAQQALERLLKLAASTLKGRQPHDQQSKAS